MRLLANSARAQQARDGTGNFDDCTVTSKIAEDPLIQDVEGGLKSRLLRQGLAALARWASNCEHTNLVALAGICRSNPH